MRQSGIFTRFFQIVLIWSEDKKFTLLISLSVQELKDKITEEQGYPREAQRLYLKNQELEEDLEIKDLMSIDSLDSTKQIRIGK